MLEGPQRTDKRDLAGRTDSPPAPREGAVQTAVLGETERALAPEEQIVQPLGCEKTSFNPEEAVPKDLGTLTIPSDTAIQLEQLNIGNVNNAIPESSLSLEHAGVEQGQGISVARRQDQGDNPQMEIDDRTKPTLPGRLSEEQLVKFRAYDALLAGDLQKTGCQWFEFAQSDLTYVREYLLVDEERRSNVISILSSILTRGCEAPWLVHDALALIPSLYDVLSPAHFMSTDYNLSLLYEASSTSESTYVLEEFLRASSPEVVNKLLIEKASFGASFQHVLRELQKTLSPETLAVVPVIPTILSLCGYQQRSYASGSCMWNVHADEMISRFISHSGFEVISKDFDAVLLKHVATFGLTSDPRLIDFSLRLYKAKRFPEVDAPDQETIRKLIDYGILKRDERSLSQMTTKRLLQDISQALDQLTYAVFTEPQRYVPLMDQDPVIEAMFLCNTTPHHPFFAFKDPCDGGFRRIKESYLRDLQSSAETGNRILESRGEFSFEAPGQRVGRYLSGIVTNSFPQRLSPQTLGLCFADELGASYDQQFVAYDFAVGLRQKIFFVPLFEKTRDDHLPPKLVAGLYLIDCKTDEGDSALLIRALSVVNHTIFKEYDQMAFVAHLLGQLTGVAASLGYDSLWTATAQAFSNQDDLVSAMYEYALLLPQVATGVLEQTEDTELNQYQSWDPDGPYPSLILWRRPSE